jgi:hypothetical protein
MRLQTVLIVILLAAVADVRADKSILSDYYSNHFLGWRIPAKHDIQAGATARRYDVGFERLWDSTIKILADRNAIVPRVSKKLGIITYIDVDDLLDGQKYRSLDFPFALLIDAEPAQTVVYVRPMLELVQTRVPPERLQVIRDVFKYKIDEFFYRLDRQVVGGSRWPWLLNQ